MIHDPDAETSEIPMAAMREQLRVLAERPRWHEEETLTTTLAMPIVASPPICHHQPGKHRRRTGASSNVTTLALAAAMLVGAGVVVRIAATANQTPIAISTLQPRVVPTPTPSLAPPQLAHRYISVPVPTATQSPRLALAAVSRRPRVLVTHRAAPTSARPSTPPPSPSPSLIPALPLPLPLPLATTTPSPSLTPLEGVVPISVPTLVLPTVTLDSVPTAMVTPEAVSSP